MAADIGMTIFVELLGMTQYPGSPFTGNIYRDLIMFLIVPTVFIIMVIYTMTGRLISDNRFRVMIGVTAYLFIIASGYYPAFALLAGPYFIFLIFILGALYFLMGHFRHGGGGFSGGGGGGFSGGGGGGDRRYKAIAMPVMDPGRRKWLTEQIKRKEKEITEKDRSLHVLREKGSTHGIGEIEAQLTALRKERDELEDELQGRTH